MTFDLGLSAPKPYAEQLKDMHAAQAGKSRAQIKEELQTGQLVIGQDADGEPIYAPKPEAVFDPESLPVRVHNWVDRGLKMSCEGANHPHHVVWKRLARK